MPTIKVPERDVLQLEDVIKLCEKEEDARVKCLVALAYTFGSRISEYMQLKKEDFEQADGQLKVRFLLKKKREGNQPYVGIRPGWERYIALDYPLVRYALEYIDSIQSGYIFPSAQSHDREKYVKYVNKKTGKVVEKFYPIKGGHLTEDWARWKLKDLDAGLYWHFFRRSAITNIAVKEKSMIAAKQFAGHASITTTERYVSKDPAIDERLAARKY